MKLDECIMYSICFYTQQRYLHLYNMYIYNPCPSLQHARSIDLRIHFAEDLHPFYPPKVSLIRPRLCLLPGKGRNFPFSALDALMSLHFLSLKDWSSTITTPQLLSSIKTFIEGQVGVDFDQIKGSNRYVYMLTHASSTQSYYTVNTPPAAMATTLSSNN
jgi:hypothetical protein